MHKKCAVNFLLNSRPFRTKKACKNTMYVSIDAAFVVLCVYLIDKQSGLRDTGGPITKI
jgi:hypothetical protein